MLRGSFGLLGPKRGRGLTIGPPGSFTLTGAPAAGGARAADLEWTASSGASTYKAYRGAEGASTVTKDATTLRTTITDGSRSFIDSLGAALAKGTASRVLASSTQVDLSATEPTGGVTPYTYQWYRSTDGSKGTAISGATTRSYSDTGLTTGTKYYWTLEATDAAAAIVNYDQIDGTPGTYAAPDYATQKKDGTLADYQTSYPETDVFPTTDPTGFGRGNVIQVNYQAGAAPGSDVNRSFNFRRASGAEFALGGECYMRADIYLEKLSFGTGDIRKLIYWQGLGAISTVFGVLVLRKDKLSIEAGSAGSLGSFNATDNGIATFTAGRWYTLEMYFKNNTAYGSSNGIVTVWVDGAQVHTRSDYRFLQEAGDYLNICLVGDQAQLDVPEAEYRVFDRTAFSSARVGP